MRDVFQLLLVWLCFDLFCDVSMPVFPVVFVLIFLQAVLKKKKKKEKRYCLKCSARERYFWHRMCLLLAICICSFVSVSCWEAWSVSSFLLEWPVNENLHFRICMAGNVEWEMGLTDLFAGQYCQLISGFTLMQIWDWCRRQDSGITQKKGQILHSQFC